MTKHPTSIRLSGPARDKLEALTELYGSQTMAIEVAIDRLYQQEDVKMRATMTGDYPPMAGQTVSGKTPEDIRRKLGAMLSVDGPRGLTAVTASGTEIHAELYEGQDYIRQR